MKQIYQVLTASAIFGSIAQVAVGQAFSASKEFEVASVKLLQGGRRGAGKISFGLGRMTISDRPLTDIIRLAYGVQPFQLVDGPEWLAHERYEILAKAGEAVGREDMLLMLRSLLENRFKLTLHHGTRQFPTYALLVGKNGPKFSELTGDDQERRPLSTLSTLAAILSNLSDRPVVDATGLKGHFTIAVNIPPRESIPPDVSPQEYVLTYIVERLGLKLKPQNGPVDVLILDHVERVPTEN